MNVKTVYIAVIVLVCLCGSSAISQVSEVITRADGTHTVYYDSEWDELPSAEGAAYYRSITYKNGKPIGLTRDFYISGKPQWVGRITAEHKEDSDNENEGKVTYYYENGKISETRNYKNGKMHGASTSYYESGRIKYTSKYIDGQEDGLSILYREDGRKYAEYKYRSNVIKEAKFFWDSNKGYNIVYSPIWNESTKTFDGEYHRYYSNGEKQDVVIIKSDRIVETTWKAPAKYTKSKEWQAAKKNGVRYFAGTWYGTAPAVNPYQPPTTYRLDVSKSRKGDYYIWKVENSWLGDEQSYCSHGYANEVGFYGDANSFPNVTEMRYEEKADQGIVELCGNFYGNRDCRVLFGYSDDRGWFTVTRTQYVNLKKIR